jgi:hypothetical protein
MGAILLGGLFVLIGIVRIWWSRLAAFRWFNRAILISLLITQLLRVHEAQLAAVIGLVVSLVVWATLQYLIQQEIEIQGAEAGAGNEPTDRQAGS